MHSSIVPLGLPVGILVGCLTYNACHSLGAGPLPALMIAKFTATTANLAVGGAKNVFTGDLISLFTVRPLSAIGSVWTVAAIYAGAAT